MELRMGLWLLTSMGLGAIMFLWHKRKTGQSEQVGTSDSYSNITLYFDPINGEGHLFIGGTLIIISFSLFVYELSQIIVGFIGLTS